MDLNFEDLIRERRDEVDRTLDLWRTKNRYKKDDWYMQQATEKAIFHHIERTWLHNTE
jgi:hypothetical protein